MAAVFTSHETTAEAHVEEVSKRRAVTNSRSRQCPRLDETSPQSQLRPLDLILGLHSVNSESKE